MQGIEFPGANIQLTPGVMSRFQHTFGEDAWMRSDIIDAYFHMLQLREADSVDSSGVHFFTTSFASQLFTKDGKFSYDAVARYTRRSRIQEWGQKRDAILDCRYLYIPACVNDNHWILIVVDVSQLEVKLYDPMASFKSLSPVKTYVGEYRDLMNAVSRYVMKQWTADQRETRRWLWSYEAVKDIPLQNRISQNWWDCGVYVMTYANFLSAGVPLRAFHHRTPLELRRLTEQAIVTKDVGVVLVDVCICCNSIIYFEPIIYYEPFTTFFE